MTTPNVLHGSSLILPPALKNAQDAIHLPQVQEMLRKLSEYNLGIFMPHMFMSTLVNSGCSAGEVIAITRQAERFLPVAWAWRAGGASPLAVL